MNFFKSVFSDDAESPQNESEPDSPKIRGEEQNLDQDSSSEQSNPRDGGGWSFSGLMKTLATRSESVMETYRRDLQDFGSGLKKEIEVAQGSLGTLGTAFDEFGNSVLKGTAQIIAQGKDAILTADHESDSSDNNSSTKSYGVLSSKRYSRFDAQVRVFQGDSNTYCEEPDDLDDFNKWKLGFALDQKGEELETLFVENGDMRSIYERVVPSIVDHETFWYRYFYKVFKFKQAEDLRATLVKRAISQEDEEELSWDIDDEEEDDGDDDEKVVKAAKEVSKKKLKENEEMGGGDIEQKVKDEMKNVDSTDNEASLEENKESGDKDSEKISEEKNGVEKLCDGDVNRGKTSDSGDKASKESVNESIAENVDSKKENLEPESETKAGTGELSKTDDDSNQSPVQEEDDLGWDEIEDLSGIDEKEVTCGGGSPNRAELRKRLSAVEEDEDLSWDIEDDDDEPAKA